MMPLFWIVGQILISADKTLNDDNILNNDVALKEYNHNEEKFTVYGDKSQSSDNSSPSDQILQ